MSGAEVFLLLGVALAVLGSVRLLLTGDLLRRVLALNVAASGVLMMLVALAHRADPAAPDPVLHALVLTGIVITVAVTGLALGLVRRVERPQQAEGARPSTPATEGFRTGDGPEPAP